MIVLTSPTLGGVKLFDNQHFTLMIGKRILNKQLIENGTIPVYSANVFEPFGFVDNTLFDDFSRPSILWGIDGDWQVNYMPKNCKFYPTDHCGVLTVVSEDFNAHFVRFMLEMEGEKTGFSRSFRASIDRVESISIPKVDIELQNSIMHTVESIQAQIKALECSLLKLEEKQQAIIEKFILKQE